jgi:hypothetical protein
MRGCPKFGSSHNWTSLPPPLLRCLHPLPLLPKRPSRHRLIPAVPPAIHIFPLLSTNHRLLLSIRLLQSLSSTTQIKLSLGESTTRLATYILTVSETCASTLLGYPACLSTLGSITVGSTCQSLSMLSRYFYRAIFKRLLRNHSTPICSKGFVRFVERKGMLLSLIELVHHIRGEATPDELAVGSFTRRKLK